MQVSFFLDELDDQGVRFNELTPLLPSPLRASVKGDGGNALPCGAGLTAGRNWGRTGTVTDPSFAANLPAFAPMFKADIEGQGLSVSKLRTVGAGLCGVDPTQGAADDERAGWQGMTVSCQLVHDFHEV